MDKYQVLEQINAKGVRSKFSIIVKPDDTAKLWRMYIPDAGDRPSATRVARLLNAEYEAHQKVLAERNTRDIHD